MVWNNVEDMNIKVGNGNYRLYLFAQNQVIGGNSIP